MIEPWSERIQSNGEAKKSEPEFMKYAGSINGPPDLSSRPGFSREVVEKMVEEKAEIKPSKKAPRRQTRRPGN
jgi:hypothetical protein